MPRLYAMVVGLMLFTVTCVAWLFAAIHNVDPGPLFYIAGPVISAIFLAPAVGDAAKSASLAANNTNGQLDGRIKSAMASALSERDATRTRQAVGDISIDNAAIAPIVPVIPANPEVQP